MNSRQARLFAIGSTAAATIIFLGLTIDSHRQFPTLTNAENITPEVKHGMAVWHKYNCINCHTLFGEGAYYAPDLTKITKHRGQEYLKAYMRNPALFYDEQRHRRLMPNQNLGEEEISDLIAFLDWVSNVDNQGWPPRPILVTGGMVPGAMAALSGGDVNAAPPGLKPVDPDDDDRALGEQVFFTAVPACSACHSTAPDVNLAGPTMAGLRGRTEALLAAGDYGGQAEDVAGYIRESIVSPSAHLVPGAMYSAGGVSFMPDTYDSDLTEEQLDQLVAYLMSLN
jgi:nitric oxide reductase subunit C